ncbi:MAG: hypothetical protein WBC48_01510 [Minisyncoccales bacterium]
MAKSSKKQPVTLESLAQIMAAGFSTLDKKIDTKFGILDKKIDDTSEQLLIKMQQGFLEQIERIGGVERDVAELKAGQARIEANLAGAARNIDLMNLRAEVEILKRKV